MKKTLFIFVATLALLSPLASNALYFDPHDNDATGQLGDIDTVDLGAQTPTVVALNLINAALSLLAAVCVGLLIYAGFLWIWARGNQDEVKRAKDIIQGTVIGLVIVLAALGVTQFIFTTIGDITGAEVTTEATTE